MPAVNEDEKVEFEESLEYRAREARGDRFGSVNEAE